METSVSGLVKIGKLIDRMTSIDFGYSLDVTGLHAYFAWLRQLPG
jgi:hypothetical protein